MNHKARVYLLAVLAGLPQTAAAKLSRSALTRKRVRRCQRENEPARRVRGVLALPETRMHLLLLPDKLG